MKPEPWVSWTFDEAKTLDYDLPGSLNIETQAYPLVQAFATDNAATVSIGQPSPTNGGRATIRVTPADGGEAATYTVDFGPLYQLTGLKVTPAKTAYKVGEAFDHDGFAVTAVYTAGKRTPEKTIPADDPELTVTGFDSHAAAERQIITVTYRGVSASFVVAIAPNGDQQPTTPSKPGDGDACKRLPAANRRSRRVRHSPRCAVM